MSGEPPTLRPAQAADALPLRVLGQQVFLDTYATEGIRPSLAREVLETFSERETQAALADAGSCIRVAERDGHLVGFAHLRLRALQALAPAGVQAELLRLYVQAPFAGRGLGRALLADVERRAREGGATVLWLTVWVHNARARAFYARHGFSDCGSTWYEFEGERHENRVLARRLDGAAAR
ncbi:MAG: GNAT family N-acetyltransferase [Burkholderiaceae bacterium]|jgi:diamine N-acetyltransferase|nr:GNAT family N-acetyltransferase [Burkholderiaceae bacterium]